ncbi:polyketide synthase dehydratase domain-containing protein, partial [Nonomuraea sp. NPDC047529]|uniref:polyketide synthase dehydratase domain-containing protein n=1 Tax=Nonomuraea sp. NPDC047529 TaxID=3155623 RepID=UPI0033DA7197
MELVIRAGDGVGCSRVEELTLEAPLVLDTDSSAQVLVRVSGAGADGRREVHVYARPGAGTGTATGTGAGTAAGEGWRRHASAVITESAVNSESAESVNGDGAEAGFELGVWPPVGAQAVEVEGFYQKLAETGYGYGPAFQGVKRAWVRGGEVFAEVELGERECVDAARFEVHPALLDAALHAIGLAEQSSGGDAAGEEKITVPFSWKDVRLYAAAARQLRVRLRLAEDGAITVEAADAAGRPVVSIGSLVLRELGEGQLVRASGSSSSLLRMDWVPWSGSRADSAPGEVIVVGPSSGDVVAGVRAAGGAVVGHYSDLSALDAGLAAGEPTTGTVILHLDMGAPTHDEHGELLSRLRVELDRVVEVLRGWLASERSAETRLVLLTTGVVTVGHNADPGTTDPGNTGPGNDGRELVGAAVLGLARSAQAEHPGRFLLADVDGQAASWQALANVLGTGSMPGGVGDEPQILVRQGRVLVPRLTPARPEEDLAVPDGDGAWRLDCPTPGSVEGLALVPEPGADRDLDTGQVRVQVRAAGLNFRDVLNVLGMYPGEAGPLGVEFAGVVSEVGPGVEQLVVGDRVMGLGEGTFGPHVVTDQRLMVKIPEGWSFADAAAVPGAFATAWYGLVDLAGLSRGERVLIHAGAGGVGMAAIQIARHLGAEVFTT